MMHNAHQTKVAVTRDAGGERGGIPKAYSCLRYNVAHTQYLLEDYGADLYAQSLDVLSVHGVHGGSV